MKTETSPKEQFAIYSDDVENFGIRTVNSKEELVAEFKKICEANNMYPHTHGLMNHGDHGFAYLKNIKDLKDNHADGKSYEFMCMKNGKRTYLDDDEDEGFWNWFEKEMNALEVEIIDREQKSQAQAKQQASNAEYELVLYKPSDTKFEPITAKMDNVHDLGKISDLVKEFCIKNVARPLMFDFDADNSIPNTRRIGIITIRMWEFVKDVERNIKGQCRPPHSHIGLYLKKDGEVVHLPSYIAKEPFMDELKKVQAEIKQEAEDVHNMWKIKDIHKHELEFIIGLKRYVSPYRIFHTKEEIIKDIREVCIRQKQRPCHIMYDEHAIYYQPVDYHDSQFKRNKEFPRWSEWDREFITLNKNGVFTPIQTEISKKWIESEFKNLQEELDKMAEENNWNWEHITRHIPKNSPVVPKTNNKGGININIWG